MTGAPLPDPDYGETICELAPGDERHRAFLVRRMVRDPFMPVSPHERPMGRLLYVTLNPRLADEQPDGVAIRQASGRAKPLGCDKIGICSLFTLRTTDADGLLAQADRLHPDADLFLDRAFDWLIDGAGTSAFQRVMFAIGDPPSSASAFSRTFLERLAAVRERLDAFGSNGFTRGYTPRGWPVPLEAYGKTDGAVMGASRLWEKLEGYRV